MDNDEKTALRLAALQTPRVWSLPAVARKRTVIGSEPNAEAARSELEALTRWALPSHPIRRRAQSANGDRYRYQAPGAQSAPFSTTSSTSRAKSHALHVVGCATERSSRISAIHGQRRSSPEVLRHRDQRSDDITKDPRYGQMGPNAECRRPPACAQLPGGAGRFAPPET